MIPKSCRGPLSALLVISILAMSPAKADAVADFYKEKTVTVIVSTSAGGGYDTMARAIARFIGRHMPGPSVTGNPEVGGATENCAFDELMLVMIRSDLPVLQIFAAASDGPLPHAGGNAMLPGT